MAIFAPANLDDDAHAAAYARHRRIHPGVRRDLIARGNLGADSNVLDVGCGTGNYGAALHAEIGCRITGVDPSLEMLERAWANTDWDDLVHGKAESLPFPDDTFDLVLSTDVIHHVRNRDAYFREAARVLRPGGQIATVTDAPDDIVRRRPLSSHFPETIEVELRRYPSITLLLEEMARAGFIGIVLAGVEQSYHLDSIQPYRDRAYSSLLLIDSAAVERGVARLEDDLARGPIPCLSLYTLIWGSVPHSNVCDAT